MEVRHLSGSGVVLEDGASAFLLDRLALSTESASLLCGLLAGGGLSGRPRAGLCQGRDCRGLYTESQFGADDKWGTVGVGERGSVLLFSGGSRRRLLPRVRDRDEGEGLEWSFF